MKKQSIQDRTFDLLEATGLNWSVSKEPLVSAIDGAAAPKAYGIFKKINRTHLAVVGPVYEPFQNASLAEAIIVASDQVGLEATRGGSLNGGGKVYIQAQLPDVFIGKSNVKRWLTALNSHDGTTSIGFGSSNTVVICGNTFYRAYKELQKVRHTMSAEERIKVMAKEMNATILRDEKLMDMFKVFADTSLNESLLDKVIRNIFEVETGTLKSEISTRKLNQVKAFKDSLQTEIELEGATVWGLFNGITRYTNHILAPKAEDKKTDFLMTGRGYDISNKTFDLLVKELKLDILQIA